MSKDRDGIEDNERLAPAGDDATVSSGDVEPTDLTDPESDAPDALDIEAEMDAAEQAEGSDRIVDVGSADDDHLDDHLDDGLDDHLDDGLDDHLDDGLDDGLNDNERADAEMAVVAAGSSRAGARRGSTRAGVTAKKDAPTKQRANPTRDGLIARLSRFLREVVAELRKVIWPSRKQMITYTVVVIVFLAVMVALVSGLDVLFHLVVGKVLG